MIISEHVFHAFKKGYCVVAFLFTIFDSVFGETNESFF